MKDCLYIDNHILVVGKDHNTSLSDLKERIKEDLKKENQKNSFIEQINPLSSLASGIVVFALSSKAKERLIKQIQDKTFAQRFFAVCVGTPKDKNNVFQEEQKQYVMLNQKNKKLELVPMLYANAFEISNRYKLLQSLDRISLVEIFGGLAHEDEIRFFMSNLKSSIFGDKLYEGDTLAKDTNLALSLVEVRFVHPITNKNLVFEYYPNTDKKPWSFFDVKRFLKI